MFNPFPNFQNIFNNIQFQPIGNINHKSSTNIYRIAKNTSLTRVLQCLCDIYKNDISLKNKIFTPTTIVSIIVITYPILKSDL